MKIKGLNCFRDINLRTLLRFFHSLWEFSPGGFTKSASLRIVSATFPFFQLYLGKLILDEIITLSRLQAAERQLQYVIILIAGELLLIILWDLLGKLSRLYDWTLSEVFKHKISLKIVEHAAKLELEQYENSQFYDRIERINNQAHQQISLIDNIFQMIQLLITTLSLVAGLVFLKPLIIVALLISIIPMLLSHLYFNRKNYELNKVWTAKLREVKYSRDLQTNAEVIKDFKVFSLYEFFKERGIKIFEDYFSTSRNLMKESAQYGFLYSMLTTLAFYGAYVYFIMETYAGRFSIGELVFISGACWRIRDSVQNFMTSFSSVSTGILLLNEFYDFFSLKSSVANRPGTLRMPIEPEYGFVFENVSFKYKDADQWALRNINLSLKPGELIGIIGENGSGKSTFLKLLLRLYQPTVGRILLDGVNIADIRLDDYYARFSVLFQDFGRFQLNAGLNIAIGHLQLRDDLSRIRTASEIGFSKAFIDNLPEKYDQLIGKMFPGGVELSGGQWQRIALSRVFMRKAQVYILDEPTSALDPYTEKKAFDKIIAHTQGALSIFVSHKISLICRAKKIIVFDSDTIAEFGTHEELLQSDGIYSSLFADHRVAINGNAP